jgi:hypothetical protein
MGLAAGAGKQFFRQSHKSGKFSPGGRGFNWEMREGLAQAAHEANALPALLAVQ